MYNLLKKNFLTIRPTTIRLRIRRIVNTMKYESTHGASHISLCPRLFTLITKSMFARQCMIFRKQIVKQKREIKKQKSKKWNPFFLKDAIES